MMTVSLLFRMENIYEMIVSQLLLRFSCVFSETHPEGVRKLNSCSMEPGSEEVIYFSLESKTGGTSFQCLKWFNLKFN